MVVYVVHFLTYLRRMVFPVFSSILQNKRFAIGNAFFQLILSVTSLLNELSLKCWLSVDYYI